MERSKPIEARGPTPCQVHGRAFLVFDVSADEWVCSGQGGHWRRAVGEPTPEMLATMKRLGIEPGVHE